ncbi:hypothetical protein JDV02_003773 [Purpureocillium takamizusanense]|uniref:N-acetyltransferase domain-containing protein n=1 Tax=Purpureocillium takamizusanense TaxID=2060973 RepID=A0A9Q8QD36_9HYPO|nr:uncharacterized protein JDV02_003773 [Purpureocillium takamizusanense]UNI17430.1 hypothetical protein JDV02_003773 [Purpureocillium takamizusanense]
MLDAFRDSLFHQRCFPTSDPASRESLVRWVDKNLADPASHMIIAERDISPAHPLRSAPPAGTVADADAPPPPVAGFARWVRRPTPSTAPAPAPAPARDSSPPPPPPAAPEPRMVFTPDMYPAGGDATLAARVFQANYDALMQATSGRDAWFLSMLVVPREHQRRGVGTALLRYGLERADRDGWAAYVNASSEGKPLYDKNGFATVERSEFGDIVEHHMLREPEGKS